MSSEFSPSSIAVTEGRGPLLAASWTLLAASVALALGAAALTTASANAATAAYEAFIYIAIGLLGVAVTSRQPRNVVGWLLQLIGLALALNAIGTDVYLLASAAGGTVDGAAAYAAWVIEWVWILAIVPAFTYFPLLFPTGRLPSPRWRLLLGIAVVATALTWFGTAFAPGPLDVAPDVQNPLGVDLPGVERLGELAFMVLIPVTLASIGSLVLRFRRSTGVERQQLKWVAASAVLLPVGFASLGLVDDLQGDVTGFLLLLTSLLLVVASVAVAMLRYRLYDIDVVINRALVYVTLTVLLAAAYVGGVLLLQLALRPLTRSSDLAVAGSTLAVAALFRPARERIRALVDRRFYRSRYDATQTLAQFTAHLRDQLDADALADDICRVVEDTVQPTHVTLWVPPKTERGAP